MVKLSEIIAHQSDDYRAGGENEGKRLAAECLDPRWKSEHGSEIISQIMHFL